MIALNLKSGVQTHTHTHERARIVSLKSRRIFPRSVLWFIDSAAAAASVWEVVCPRTCITCQEVRRRHVDIILYMRLDYILIAFLLSRVTITLSSTHDVIRFDLTACARDIDIDLIKADAMHFYKVARYRVKVLLFIFIVKRLSVLSADCIFNSRGENRGRDRTIVF